jgi:hypothetical protein
MMSVEDQWHVTAHHEAGHAIAYLHFGWKFGTIKIHQTDKGRVVGRVTSPSGRYGCLQYAICCIAGPIAEEHLTGVSLDEQHDSYRDVVMAQDALARITIGEGLERLRRSISTRGG